MRRQQINTCLVSKISTLADTVGIALSTLVRADTSVAPVNTDYRRYLCVREEKRDSYACNLNRQTIRYQTCS